MSPFEIRTEEELRNYIVKTLRLWMGRADELALRVPRLQGMMRSLPGMPYHLLPELFLQISGETVFRFPEEELRVGPMEICLVPRGMPHGERVRPLKEPFLNLVVLLGHGVVVHLAKEVRPGMPQGFASLRLERVSEGFTALLDEVGRLFQAGGDVGDLGARAAFRAALATLLVALERGEGPIRKESFKVMQACRVIDSDFHEPDFSVATLAARLQCNPDYLSHLFRKEIGMTLQHYIQEQRLQRAVILLHSTLLNISEISAAVGFRDPSYFTRAFHRWAGVTPREVRRLIDSGAAGWLVPR